MGFSVPVLNPSYIFKYFHNLFDTHFERIEWSHKELVSARKAYQTLTIAYPFDEYQYLWNNLQNTK